MDLTSGRRRRQPLLRDARRVHPSPRPRSSAGGACRSCSRASAPLLLAGGKMFRFIPNPTFDPIIVPGCIDLMFRGQVPEGVDPRDADAGRAAAPRVPGPRRAPRGDGRAGPRPGAHVPDARVRARAGAARRHPGDDGHAARVQPVARRGLGLLVPGPDRSRVPMLSLADPAAAVDELDWLLDHDVRDRAPPAGAGARPRRRGRSFGARRARSGLGAPRRGRRARRVPPRRQRLRARRRRVGCP